MFDGNEFAELLWENGQAVVHPQPAFPPLGYGGTGSSGVHPVGDAMATFAKTGDVFGDMAMAPSVHAFASGLHAAQANGHDDPVPWIHQPIVDDDDDNTAPTTHYCSDFSSELPPSKRNATNSKEVHGLPAAPTSRISEPQSELAAAKQPPTSGSVEWIFSRPAAQARASMQRPQGTDEASNLTASNGMESTASWPRPVFTDQTATAGKLRQERAPAKVSSSNTTVHKDSGSGVVHELPCLHKQKPKIQDLDDASGASGRSANRSMKRGRTAEVHNLSERRRRGRINERMRALQDLIPNCNKIDKASMLDEAVEYLKTLQLQVQMMSMGTGLSIHPMLLPPAMQRLHIPAMSHFAHLGMGLEYGMGVLDMNNTGAIPMPAIHGTHFPCPMVPGSVAQSLGNPGANAMPMLGVPGHATPSSASSVPPFASLAGRPVRPNLAPQVSGAIANMVKEQHWWYLTSDS